MISEEFKREIEKWFEQYEDEKSSDTTLAEDAAEIITILLKELEGEACKG